MVVVLVVVMSDVRMLVLHGRSMIMLLLLLLLLLWLLLWLLLLMVVVMLMGFEIRQSMMERVGDKRMRGCESG